MTKTVCEQEVEFTAPLKFKRKKEPNWSYFYLSDIMRWVLLPETHMLDLKALVSSIVLSGGVKFFLELT